MKRRFGLIVLGALVASTLAYSVPVRAACINTLTGTVDNINDCLEASKNATDCRLAMAVDFDGAGGPPPDPKKIECTDGDACDADGVINGSCTFLIGACVNAGGTCPSVNASSATLKKPSTKDAANAVKKPRAFYTRRTVTTALDGILPSAVEVCTAADLEIVIPLDKSKKGICNSPAKQKCENDQQCDDYCIGSFKKKKKTKIGLAIDDQNGKKADSDNLKLTCLKSTAASAVAEALQISNPADLIGGPLAMSEVGDFMIRNSKVRAVVRDVGRLHSFMLLNGGQIIDADLVRANPADDNDNWLGMQPLVQISSTQATNSVVVLNDGSNGLPAVIRSSGPDDLFDVIKPDVMVWSSTGISVPPGATDVDLPLQLTTDFILAADRNYIQIATKFDNTSGSNLDLYVGDFINAGGTVEPFGPGVGFGEPLLRNGGDLGSKGNTLDFIAYRGAGDAAGLAYGVVFPQTVPGTTRYTSMFSQTGVHVWANSQDLFSLLFGSYNNKDTGSFAVPANGTNTLRRWFVIGETIDDVAKARIDLFSQDYGVLQGTVTVAGVPVEGASVVVMNDKVNYESSPSRCSGVTTDCTGVVNSTVTDASGFYRMHLAASSNPYRVAVRVPGVPYEGGGNTPAKTEFVIKKKKTVVQDIDLPGTATLTVNVQDQSGAPIPAKVSIVGVPASPDPLNSEFVLVGVAFEGRLFGYPVEEKGDVFGVVDARFADSTGSTGTFDLEPGSYTVVVSHGPEYDADVISVTLAAGDSPTLNATVNHVVDTTGFVSIDTHVHMINSPDSMVPRERRILTMLAEGVDFFANTDHDFAHDLSDEVSAMAVGNLIKTAPSMEVTTSHYGHFNIWPFTLDPASRIGGAIDWGRPQSVANNGLGYPSNGSYDLLPAEIFATVNPATQVIQINHFNSASLGHFNMLGIDTAVSPPTSSNQVYRCSGGSNDGAVCETKICLGGGNDGLSCSSNANCPGGTCHNPSIFRSCPSGSCVLTGSNLGAYLRLDPAVSNLYDDNFTALEVLIEANRSQTDTFLTENLGDWFGLLNQGRFKTGIADSDTHQSVTVQAGGPRTFVASSTDNPALIDPAALALNTNAGRALGSAGLFVTATLNGAAAATATHALGSPLTVTAAGGGADSVDIHVESPTWAEFDTIDVYVNTVPSCQSEWTFLGVINPSSCTVSPTITLVEGVDFTRVSSVGVSGFGSRYTADVNVPLTISSDAWVVVVARGTDGVSAPLFPMNPQDLDDTVNLTLADLTDAGGPLPWNLGEQGQTAVGFTNPLFFDFGGDGFCNGGTACP